MSHLRVITLSRSVKETERLRLVILWVIRSLDLSAGRYLVLKGWFVAVTYNRRLGCIEHSSANSRQRLGLFAGLIALGVAGCLRPSDSSRNGRPTPIPAETSCPDVVTAAGQTTRGIDTQWGLLGETRASLGFEVTRIAHAAVQPDGRIVIAGDRPLVTDAESRAAGIQQAFLARLLADGAIDTSFGIRGVVTVDDGPSVSASMSLTEDGDILTSGALITGPPLFSGRLARRPTRPYFRRYHRDGARDDAFVRLADNALQSLPLEVGSPFVIQPDQRIWLVGTSPGAYTGAGDRDVAAAVLRPDGSLERFVIDDRPRQTWGMQSVAGFGVHAQPNGGLIITAGEVERPRTGRIILFRWQADGTKDLAFGTGGLIEPRQSQDDTLSIQVAIAANSDIIIAATHYRGQYTSGGGIVPTSGQPRLVVSRYLSDGRAKTQFGAVGSVALGTGSCSTYGTLLTVTGQGTILVGSRISYNYPFDPATEVHAVIFALQDNGEIDYRFGWNGILSPSSPQSAKRVEAILSAQPARAVVIGLGNEPIREASYLFLQKLMR